MDITIKWLTLPQPYDKYEINEHGDIRNIRSKRLLTPHVNGEYVRVRLILTEKKNKKCLSKCVFVHKLMALVYHENPNNHKIIDHIDRNPGNNTKENLRWIDAKGSAQNRKQKTQPGRKVHQIDKKTKKIVKTWENMCDIVKELGIYKSQITMCCQGKYKTAGGWMWKYCDEDIQTEWKIHSCGLSLSPNGLIKYPSGRITKGTLNRGYRMIRYHKKTYCVHRLVAELYIPNLDEQRNIVNHKNGIRDDNRVENLEWVTLSENINHAIRTGLLKNFSSWASKKIKCVYVNENREKIFDSATAAKEELGVGKNTIWRHCKGTVKNPKLPYRFSYYE